MAQRSKSGNAQTSLRAKFALAGGGILLLLLVLVATEGLLAVVGVGPARSLFIEREYFGQQVYQLNRDISEFFFPKWATKPPAYEQIPKAKPAGAYRLLATGASTTMGDPFGVQTAFPALVGEMLTDATPATEYQIANCAVIAISSLDVLQLHKKALNYDPDAILIYCGHNEAYGADGIDTPVQKSFSSRGAAKFWLWFRNLRLVRLARGALGRLNPPNTARDDPAAQGFGMWLMRDRFVAPASEKHARMLSFYRENILEMLAAARAKGVDIILCTLISNVRDQSPMGSVHGPGFTAQNEGSWRAALSRGSAKMEAGEWDTARRALTEARDLDPDYAEVRFRLGRCWDALGDSSAAYAEYLASRDCDAVHFRACSAQNEVLRQIAHEWEMRGEHALVFVDLERRLLEEFPYGPGQSFFTEHVHPYPRGHAWIAETIVRTLAASPLAERLGTWDLAALEPPTTYIQRRGMSALDVAAGLVLTDLHKLAKWPFPNCYENPLARAYIKARLVALAAQMSATELQIYEAIPADRTGDLYDFGKRHYLLFSDHRQKREGQAALRELAIAQSYWWPEAFLETDKAQVLAGLRQFDQAEYHLQRARALDPDYAPIHFVAGALLHAAGDLPAAREEFQAYLRADRNGAFANSALRALEVLGEQQRRSSR